MNVHPAHCPVSRRWQPAEHRGSKSLVSYSIFPLPLCHSLSSLHPLESQNRFRFKHQACSNHNPNHSPGILTCKHESVLANRRPVKEEGRKHFKKSTGNTTTTTTLARRLTLQKEATASRVLGERSTIRVFKSWPRRCKPLSRHHQSLAVSSAPLIHDPTTYTVASPFADTRPTGNLRQCVISTTGSFSRPRLHCAVTYLSYSVRTRSFCFQSSLTASAPKGPQQPSSTHA